MTATAPIPKRAAGSQGSRAHVMGDSRRKDAERSHVALGRAVRRLRVRYGLTPTALARRSGLARSTVYRIEDGTLGRPRRCTLSALALAFSPDRQLEILARLVAAAGGEDALAPDGRWQSYRRRRLEQGILAGTVPLPSKLARSLELHRAADAAWLKAMAVSDRPGALDDARALTEEIRLLDLSRNLRRQAGPPVSLYVGAHLITAGFGVP